MGELEGKTGKRTLPEQGLPKGAKIAIIVTAAVLALLVGGYLGLCGYVSAGSTILPKTTAAGIDLGGLTRAEAQAKLTTKSAEELAGQRVIFTYPGDQQAEISGENLELDATATADAAFALGRESGFLGGGLGYLKAVFGGHEVAAPIRFSPEGERQVEDAIANIEAHLTQRVEETEVKLDGDNLTMIKGVSGMSIDATAVKANVLAAFQAGEGKSGESAFAVEPQITAPLEPNFDLLYNEYFTEVADAYLDKDTKEIIPSVTGIAFDTAAAESALAAAAEGTVCSVPLHKTEPKMTTEKLKANLFKDTLASVNTRAAGPNARWHNIKLACTFINGVILLPGEEFSYNNTCQPYTLGNGYQNAGTYQNGKSVDATAGGICQLSSTLYWATLEANLETVERHQHGMNGGYMRILGTDAVVWGGGQDLRFKNDTEYPVKIEAFMDGANVYVKLHGTSNGLRGEPFNKLISTVPARTIYEPNAAIPQGSQPQKDKERYALSGSTVEVYLRVVDQDGNTVDTKYLHKNTYAKRDAVYFYNPADAALWGIDPATGLKTLTPVGPSPEPTDPLDPTAPPVDPNVPTDPTVPPVVEPTTPPVETVPPVVEPTVPPTETVPPVAEPTVPPSPAPPPEMGLPAEG